MLEGGTSICLLCGGTGWTEGPSSSPSPAERLDPKMGISLICGAIAAYLLYPSGIETAVIAGLVVTVVARYTIADMLVKILGGAVKIALVIGLIALLAYCAK